MKALSAAQMQALDRRAIEDLGIPGVVLMENAGRAVAEEILRRFLSETSPRALILAGKGNNGGDGYVAARHLLNKGWQVQTLVLAKREAISGDAATHLSILERCGASILFASEAKALFSALAPLNGFTVVVDALFGTGLSKPVSGLYQQAIEWINRQPARVVAVDIPSGVDASSGRVPGAAVRAALTVTFAFAKIGHFSYPGAGLAGELVVADISIPEALLEQPLAESQLIEHAEGRCLLPNRLCDGHKGTFGHLLLVAGSTGKSGAAALAAEAGLRGGAGLVTLACPESLQPTLAAKLTEVMTAPLVDAKGELGLPALDDILSLSAGKQALAVGPGLGLSAGAGELVRSLIQRCPLPMVLDADALTALSGHTQILRGQTAGPLVLTPHPGEMARLANLTVAEVQEDRFNVAREFAMRHQLVLVLKGARTLTASPDGLVNINSSGHAGLASGGMGDVLTGLIGSFLAQGLAALDAATLGVYLHGLAADRLLPAFGDAGLLATDVIRALPATRQALLKEV